MIRQYLLSSFVALSRPPLEPDGSNECCKNLQMQPDQGTPEEENGALQVHVAVLEGSFSVVGVVGFFFLPF